MEKKQLHPSVKRFKEFAERTPGLPAAVRRGEHTWQELYEDWCLLGEDDPSWKSFGKPKSETETSKEPVSDPVSGAKGWIESLMVKLKTMDAAQLEKMAGNLNGTLQTIQSLLGQFAAGSTASEEEEIPERRNPFAFRKD